MFSGGEEKSVGREKGIWESILHFAEREAGHAQDLAELSSAGAEGRKMAPLCHLEEMSSLCFLSLPEACTSPF